ncbi:PAS domain-containing protein [Hymenobacter sp. AT01-02]|uniref:PAS domain-containing sensor histidine kinase n=1 Tax=Hymenobacter sp. AT01-02 TaxID=1571877 RepID=UPI00092FCB85|nr:PAS domain-containing protein [Hymenobacter sp. AT01-02]
MYATGQRVAGHERPVQVLTPINGKQRTYYFDFVCQPLFNEAGTVHGILVFAVDITDRALANRRAEAMDVKMRLMTDSLPQITVVTAPNGSVEYLSRQWFDYTGQTLADRNRCWQLALTAEDQRALRALLAHAATTGQVHTQELRLRRHDGEYRWHLGRLVPALDETGSVQRWYGSITDIHEQRLLSDELRRSEEQFRFLAESVPAIVWTARPDGQLDYLNSRWSLATGVPVEDTLREGWLHLLRPEQVAYTQQLFEQSMSTGQVLDMENSLRHVPTGLYRWYLHRAQPLRDASGAIVRWFGTTTDIDDYKRIQQHLEEKNAELIRTNQDLDSFVYTASHDLKQPINNMAGIFEELTRTAYFRDPDAVKLVAMFDKCLHQIYATIHDLSELVQVQKMRRGLTAELVNLAQLTQEVLLSIEEPLNSARAIVTTDFAAVPVVEFVRPNLQSVLYNLISNALKYAAPKRRPRIHLSTRLEEGHPVLLVQDNGLGIDLERFGSQMFQLFRRFHSHVEGSGLGLYLVNRIVESHGGHIVVESKVNEALHSKCICSLWVLMASRADAEAVVSECAPQLATWFLPRQRRRQGSMGSLAQTGHRFSGWCVF